MALQIVSLSGRNLASVDPVGDWTRADVLDHMETSGAQRRASLLFHGAVELTDDNTLAIVGAAAGGVLSHVIRADLLPLILAGSSGGDIVGWNARGERRVLRLVGHGAAVSFVSLSPDETMVVTGADDGTGRIWDAGSGVCRHVLRQGAMIAGGAWSPNGAVVAVWDYDSRVCFWHSSTGVPWVTLVTHGVPIAGYWHWEDRQFVTATSMGWLERWTPAATRRDVAVVGADGGAFTVAAAFSRNGEQVMTSSVGGACCVRSSRTGTIQAWLLGHDGAVTFAAWSPSGDLVATASEDASVRVWVVEHGACIRTLRVAPPELGVVMRGVWWAGETRLWACAADGRIVLWSLPEARNGLLLVEFDAQRGDLTAITATADA